MSKKVGLLLSVAFAMGVATCSDDSENPMAPAPNGTAVRRVVLMKDNFFSPVSLTIRRGDTIAWLNAGTTVHTSTSGTSCNWDGLWDTGLLNTGESFAVVFDSTGVDTVGAIPYYCIPHCRVGMTGTVTITP